MMLPPMLLRMQIAPNPHKRFGLWLPLFLLWPFVVLIAAALFPIYVLVAVGLCVASRREGKLMLLYPHAAPMLICSLRGLRVRVQSRDTLIHIELL